MDWILRHKLLAIIITVVLAGVAWYMLSGSSSPSAPVLSTEQPTQAPAGASDLVQSLLVLRAVTLSGTIFSNPAFQALQDFTTPIIPEPVGRPDPFAPLGQGNQASPSSTQGAQIFAPKR